MLLYSRFLKDSKTKLMKDIYQLAQLGVRLSDSNEGGILIHNGSKSSLVVGVKVKQNLDQTLVELKKLKVYKKVEVFLQKGDEVLYYQGRLCVSNVDDLREIILNEAHKPQYSIHLGSTMMYRDLRQVH